MAQITTGYVARAFEQKFIMRVLSIPSVESMASHDRTLRSDVRRHDHLAKKIARTLERVTGQPSKDPFHYNKALSTLSATPTARNEHAQVIINCMVLNKVRPTVHTYVNAMSVALRAGDSAGAIGFFECLCAAKVTPNVVAYTAVIRAACDAFDLERAHRFLTEMIAAKISPNVRTVQTLLRACAQLSDLESAREYINLSVEGGAMSQWALQSFIQILCHRLRIKEAQALLMEHKPLCTVGMYGIIAVAAALSGNREVTQMMSTYCFSFNKTAEAKEADGDGRFQDLMEKEAKLDCDRAMEYIANGGSAVYPRRGGMFCAPCVHVLRGDTLVVPWEEESRQRTKRRCLEIGSGSGDWAVQQCMNDNCSQWVTVELRADRVFSAWTKRTFRAVDPSQLTLVAGDARKVLGSCPKGYFDEIYVNFPEPPTFYDDPTRLYNAHMLEEIRRILGHHGLFIFVTDDGRLAHDVACQLHNMGTFESSYEPEPWTMRIPKEYGTSFFDKFWTNGSQTSRYMLRYRKAKQQHRQEI